MMESVSGYIWTVLLVFQIFCDPVLKTPDLYQLWSERSKEETLKRGEIILGNKNHKQSQEGTGTDQHLQSRESRAYICGIPIPKGVFHKPKRFHVYYHNPVGRIPSSAAGATSSHRDRAKAHAISKRGKGGKSKPLPEYYGEYAGINHHRGYVAADAILRAIDALNRFPPCDAHGKKNKKNIKQLKKRLKKKFRRIVFWNFLVPCVNDVHYYPDLPPKERITLVTKADDEKYRKSLVKAEKNSKEADGGKRTHRPIWSK